ncbi:MAG: hypothetical protein PHI38_07830 [Sulfurimonas sp.]|jgi:tetratricopeptide (TPR) repeat protein|uniref:hypothetical protein n=1 Tax=Sulfurimonas sp. TaxID=2022749 RepID=UPI0026346B46|nr:hypothetical protein [Sulfurimonas sp.]MDD3476763.1 hypothetical protein [Sulfurimonas sp.]
METIFDFKPNGMLGFIQTWQKTANEECYFNLKFFLEDLSSKEYIIFEHPILDSIVTTCRANILIRSANPRNILFFSDENFDNCWFLVQGYNFMDAVVYDNKFYAMLPESLCRPSINAISKMIEMIPNYKKYFRNHGNFIGFLLNHQRPYHFFYDQLVSIFELHEKLIENNKKIFLGLDNFYQPVFFDTQDYKEIKNDIVLFPTVLGIAKYKSNQYKKTSKVMENAICYSTDISEISNINFKKFDLTVWIGIAGEKRSWLEQIEGYQNILNQLSNFFENILILVDGLTANAHSEIPDEENKNICTLIALGLNKNIVNLSLAGKDYHTKIDYCRNIDIFISDAGATSMVPRFFCMKPGVLHFSNNPIIFTVENFSQVKMVDSRFVKNEEDENRRDLASYHISWQHIFNLTAELLNQSKGTNIQLLDVPPVEEVAKVYEIEMKKKVKTIHSDIFMKLERKITPEYKAPDILREVAFAFEQSGDISTALTIMQKALELRPTGPTIKQKVKEYQAKLENKGESK